VLLAHRSVILRILVFGPGAKMRYPKGSYEAALARKRREIRDALVADGHEVAFPEDLKSAIRDPKLSVHLWEHGLVLDYDMIVNLVGTPGAVDEIGLLQRRSVAPKSALFFLKKHIGGLPYSHAQTIERLGASLHVFTRNDLRRCHLMTAISDMVDRVRLGKYLDP